MDVEKHASVRLCSTRTGVCDSVRARQLGSCNCARVGRAGLCDWLGSGEEAAVFQPLIPQNYSSDQAGSALRGCRGHTTQPRGQPANYRPPSSDSVTTGGDGEGGEGGEGGE